jgi:CheY-like chemotaxis protein/anti-sigma regulatory factor (Ser/Thr protein kinase)
VESEIREALINLIFNAVDAVPDGGKLTLRTKMANAATGAGAGTVQIEVEDDGIGMDEDTCRRCLEPFFTTKGERGTGLGLAMVYGVVQRHGAEIDIKSTPGKGATVCLGFPVQTAAMAGTTRYDSGPAAVPTRMRLLVVDDDPVLLKSLRDILETDGHVVSTASDGQAGINAFRAARDGKTFDAVITDLGMPYVDGRRVAEAVKAASPSTPVILLTGWGQRLVSEEDIPPHVDHVLSKPPKLREVREALARCCQSAER